MAMENNYIPNSDDVIHLIVPSSSGLIANTDDSVSIRIDVIDLIKEDLLKLSNNGTEYCKVWMADVFKILDKHLKKEDE